MKNELKTTPAYLAPGYRFSLPDWPPGHVPQPWGRDSSRDREIAVRGRATALARGNTGTIPGGLTMPVSKTSRAVGEQMVARARKTAGARG